MRKYIILLGIVILTLASSALASGEWFEGGTLHKSNLSTLTEEGKRIEAERAKQAQEIAAKQLSQKTKETASRVEQDDTKSDSGKVFVEFNRQAGTFEASSIDEKKPSTDNKQVVEISVEELREVYNEFDRVYWLFKNRYTDARRQVRQYGPLSPKWYGGNTKLVWGPIARGREKVKHTARHTLGATLRSAGIFLDLYCMEGIAVLDGEKDDLDMKFSEREFLKQMREAKQMLKIK